LRSLVGVKFEKKIISFGGHNSCELRVEYRLGGRGEGGGSDDMFPGWNLSQNALFKLTFLVQLCTKHFEIFVQFWGAFSTPDIQGDQMSLCS